MIFSLLTKSAFLGFLFLVATLFPVSAFDSDAVSANAKASSARHAVLIPSDDEVDNSEPSVTRPETAQKPAAQTDLVSEEENPIIAELMKRLNEMSKRVKESEEKQESAEKKVREAEALVAKQSRQIEEMKIKQKHFAPPQASTVSTNHEKKKKIVNGIKCAIKSVAHGSYLHPGGTGGLGDRAFVQSGIHVPYQHWIFEYQN